MVTFKDIEEVYRILKPAVRKTPLERSKTFSNLRKTNVYLKEENLQTTGSFKIRGAYNKIYHLTAKEKKQGVVCASAGNHAQGVALAFFRQPERFIELQKVFIPKLLKERRALKFRSAGCSIGCEPYSLSMIMNEVDPNGAHQIIATDVDIPILQRPREGRGYFPG